MKRYTYKKSIKTKTNDNEICKQYIKILYSDGQNAVVITKLVLTKHEYYKELGFIPIKQFKDHVLIKQVFSIKINTLKKINEILDL